MLRVEGEPDLVKDDRGVIQNTNTSSYHDYVNRRNLLKQNQQRIENIEKDNIEIKATLNAILELLRDKK